MEGRPLSDVGVGGMLLLTEGHSSTTAVPKTSSSSSTSSKSSGPIDPDADIVAERDSSESRVPESHEGARGPIMGTEELGHT